MISRANPGSDCWVAYYQPPTAGAQPSMNDMDVMLGNKDMISRLMHINDVRGREDEFTLNEHGFQIVKLDTNLSSWDDGEKIKQVYFPQVQELIKRVTGAKRVVVFDHNVRRAPGNDFGAHVKGYQGIQGPAKRIHVDATPEGAESIMKFMCKDDDIEDIQRRGYQLINVWRPLKRIDRDPLIFCDMSKMASQDLIKISRSYFNGLTNSNYVCKYDGSGSSRTMGDDGKWLSDGKVELEVSDGYSNGGEHSWWHVGEQEPNEVVLFSSSGSRQGTTAPGAVHGSCALPEQEDKDVRVSIECRVIAIF